MNPKSFDIFDDTDADLYARVLVEGIVPYFYTEYDRGVVTLSNWCRADSLVRLNLIVQRAQY